MYFDTTAITILFYSNTGLKKGASTIIEQQISRNLLNLDCKYLIFEIITSKIFNSIT